MTSTRPSDSDQLYRASLIAILVYYAGWAYTFLVYSRSFIETYGWAKYILGGELWVLVNTIIWPFLILWDLTT
jgi:hypothetical protein